MAYHVSRMHCGATFTCVALRQSRRQARGHEKRTELNACCCWCRACFGACTQVVADWAGAVFALLELLPAHPSLPRLPAGRLTTGRKVRAPSLCDTPQSPLQAGLTVIQVIEARPHLHAMLSMPADEPH